MDCTSSSTTAGSTSPARSCGSISRTPRSAWSRSRSSCSASAATARTATCGVSSWRRVDDNAIPARSKITGSYVNAAFAKTEAQEAGYDEAIVLTNDGHVSEGSAENLFMVRNGTLITPPVSDNILEGIVRASVIRIPGDLKVPLEVRSIDRTELYIADELFLCGTGAQLAPVTSVDHRKVGEGTIGPITQKLSRVYFDAVHGKGDRYKEWATPVYPSSRAFFPFL